MTCHYQSDNIFHMEQSKPDFAARLRTWQKSKSLGAKQAADLLGVNLATYRHWLYGDCEPGESKCRKCIEAVIGN